MDKRIGIELTLNNVGVRHLIAMLSRQLVDDSGIVLSVRLMVSETHGDSLMIDGSGPRTIFASSFRAAIDDDMITQ